MVSRKILCCKKVLKTKYTVNTLSVKTKNTMKLKKKYFAAVLLFIFS